MINRVYVLVDYADIEVPINAIFTTKEKAIEVAEKLCCDVLEVEVDKIHSGRVIYVYGA